MARTVLTMMLLLFTSFGARPTSGQLADSIGVPRLTQHALAEPSVNAAALLRYRYSPRLAESQILVTEGTVARGPSLHGLSPSRGCTKGAIIGAGAAGAAATLFIVNAGEKRFFSLIWEEKWIIVGASALGAVVGCAFGSN